MTELWESILIRFETFAQLIKRIYFDDPKLRIKRELFAYNILIILDIC